MKKHIVIAKLSDSGGSNSHFKSLVKYLGSQNIVLILENAQQLKYLKTITDDDFYVTKITNHIHEYAHLQYRFTTNIKETFFILLSLLKVWLLIFKYNFAHLTISSIEPEKYLYMFWIPFARVTYILHTEPLAAMSAFTKSTCNFTLSQSKTLVTVSNYMKDIVCNNWGLTAKGSAFIFAVSNCIDETDFKKSVNKYDSSKRTIVTLGHVHPRKNPELWLKAARKITSLYDDVDFLWLGNGILLNRFIEETQKETRIKFLGLIKDRQPFLESATIYYQPSVEEPQGVAVIEAMYNSLPCVVSNAGGLKETVQNNFNGLVVNASELNEHITAICVLLDNFDIRSFYAANSLTRYYKHFTYKSFANNMDKIYGY